MIGVATQWSLDGGCVVFDDVLTAEEIDQIRQGTYGSGSSPTIVLQDITYNNRGQKATVRGPYPAGGIVPRAGGQLHPVHLRRPGPALEGHRRRESCDHDPLLPGRQGLEGDRRQGQRRRRQYLQQRDGSLKQVQDAKGNVTKYEYNGFMALSKTTYPDNTYEQFDL